MLRVAKPAFYASLRSVLNACHWHAAPRLALLFLRRRQAKVPDSCLHEMKALWRPPDIEHEMRDGGGDAGWVVWRLAAYYPLFLCDGDWSLHSVTVGAKRVPLARSAARGFGPRSFFLFMQHFPKSII